MPVSHAVADVVMNKASQADLGRVTALAAVFAPVKDPRKPKGVRHPLTAVLTVLTMALLCGARDFRQAADRVAELPQPLLGAAGARTHPVLGIRIPPGRDTLRRLAEAVDAAVLDRLICAWLTTLLEVRTGVGLALDGKTVRNTRPGTGVDVQLFSAMRHDTAVVIAQVQVPADTTEVTQIAALLDPVDITGMTITADAAHPSHDTATYLLKRDAGYAFTVKGNRPGLLTAITDRLPAAVPALAAATHTEHRNGHRVTRTIWTAPADGVDFPGAVQVFRIRRDTYAPDGQRVSKHLLHGITSLTCTATEIAAHVRSHWGIENKIHWIRDVLLGEDHHHAYLGTVAHAMAALRNLALALIRLAGHTRIKQLMERHHANKMLIPTLLNAAIR
ncbi:ISAs1 family transposase [Paractinoplanes brasiliensis]|uniref:IS4 family transposase n=1 Tax=Paractinoplanes brasiliensis TaxID=52695 RepID=A0A4R6JLF6_9ACTN|nr:ISAs1 family transposase [Actinoplanes brasiliensis]TDO37144.1 IS4 family transposase [Actinoplanes brasiliensis]